MAGLFYIFLCLLCLQSVTSQVEPPSNVTFHCHNMHNVLKWSYGQAPPGLRFRVNIGSMNSAPQVVWVAPPTHHADLSVLTNELDDYLVTVTAVVGQEESPSGDGIIFSYFKDSPATKKCWLELPVVNVSLLNVDQILLTFTHPWVLYQQNTPAALKPHEKTVHDWETIDMPKFTYDITVDQTTHFPGECVDSVCEEELHVRDTAQGKHCVKISGGEMEEMSVHSSKEHCAEPLTPSQHEPNNTIWIYIMVAVLVVCALIFIALMVYKAFTKPSSSVPKSMTFRSTLKQWTLGVVQESIFVPEVEPNSPTPLLSTPEDNTFTTPVDPCPDGDVRLPIGMSNEDKGVGEDEDPYAVSESGYEHRGDFEEDESPCPGDGYEKRPVLVEVAPGEQAEGYRS